MRHRAAEQFLAFIKERESIRLRKEAGVPWPWTDDPVLQRYSFTNVHRLYDRTTQLFKQIYDANKHRPWKQMLYNCGVFRWFGAPEFVQELGFQTQHNADRLRRKASDRLDRKLPVFTGAYIITSGGVKGPKEDYVTNKVLTPFWNACQDLADYARSVKSWEKVYNKLHQLPGFGGSGFMCKEVLLDAMLTPVLSDATDRLTWTPMGPGARRGLNRLMARPARDGLSDEQALVECCELHAMIAEGWDEFMDTPIIINKHRQLGTVKFESKTRPVLPLGVTDVQFQLCEYDKWQRTKRGEGRPRSVYGAPEKLLGDH